MRVVNEDYKLIKSLSVDRLITIAVHLLLCVVHGSLKILLTVGSGRDESTILVIAISIIVIAIVPRIDRAIDEMAPYYRSSWP